MVRFLFRNLKGYRFLMVLAVAMTFAQVEADILVALPLKFIIDKIVKNTDPDIAFLSGIISFFDHIGTTEHLHQGKGYTLLGVILFSVSMLIVLSVLSALLVYIQLFLASFIAQNLTARLRKQLFGHLERLSLDWHGKQKKGDLVQRITGNIADLEKLVNDGLVDSLASVFILSGVITAMVFLNWQFTVLSIAIAPALFVVVLVYTKGIKSASKKASKAAGQVAGVATEDIGAITVLKAFRLEEREDLRFRDYVGRNQVAALRAGSLQAQFTPIVAILLAIGTGIIFGVGAYVAGGNTFTFLFLTIPNNTLTVGTLTVFLAYLAKLYQPMRDFSKLTNLYTSAASGAERIQEVLDEAPEVLDPTGPYTGPEKFRGDITFENVSFSYMKDTAPVLKGINLSIPTGRKVALVGLSGGGKTTLVKLIPRFYEIQQGTVKIDGYDNRAIPLATLRQNVSHVLQESVLFEGTIRENIALGRPGANFSEIVEAAKKASIHETIGMLPDGYNTLVREQGKNFSGGQRQRLAIARAILRDAPILILDEPTASLDVEAEAEVMRALDTLIVGRTVLVISHRLSTLGNVDEIIVLGNGQVVERGTYKELKRMGRVFAGMLEEQNRYSAERAGEMSVLRSAFVPLPVGDEARPAPAAQQNWRATVPPVQEPVRQPVAPPRAGAPSGVIDGARPSTPKNARVRIELDGKPSGVHQLNGPILTIGRQSGNDIQVPSQRISRLHARIRWVPEQNAWVIEDAESLNGLVYQGQRVEQHTLSNGDHIYLLPKAILSYEAV